MLEVAFAVVCRQYTANILQAHTLLVLTINIFSTLHSIMFTSHSGFLVFKILGIYMEFGPPCTDRKSMYRVDE